MSFVKTVAIFGITAFYIIVFVPFGLLAFVLSFLGLKKPMSWAIYRLAQFWGILLIAVSGAKLRVEGRENIPKTGGICFVSNHAGYFDILLALALINRPFGFIAKKELLMVPFLNIWIHILGGYFIDRKNIRNAVKTLNRGIKKLQKGENILIFPEGTRSKGRGLLPFKSGVIKLATNSLVPIVPIAIEGSYEVFEKDYRIHSVPVRVVFCPPVITAEMNAEDRRHKLAADLRSVIETALAQP